MGETDGIQGWRKFTEVPRDQVSAEKAESAAAPKSQNAKIKQLKADGILLAQQKSEHTQGVESVGVNFLVFRNVYEGDQPLVEFYPKPWNRSEVPPVQVEQRVGAMKCTREMWRMQQASWDRLQRIPEAWELYKCQQFKQRAIDVRAEYLQ